MMNYLVLISSVLLTGLTSAAAFAQNSLGELLDSGGKKLSKADAVATISGASLSDPSKAGGVFQADFKADGSFTGSFRTPQGKGGGTFGTWTVDESGKVCTEFTSTGPMGSNKGSNCAFFYKSGDGYFISESDSDRSASLMKRTVKK